MKKILVVLLFIIFCCPQIVMAKKSKFTIVEGSGYVGTLPDLSTRFLNSESKESEPAFDYQEGFNDTDSIKPAPRNNPAFVNIIIKKDKTSQYINDLNYITAIVEKLQTVVEEQQNVQKFNAQSYFLKTNIEYFREKYKNKAEESYISFKKLMQLNTHVQAVSQLRLERENYSPYVTASGNGNMFSQNNIDIQLNYLLEDIKGTLIILKEAK